MGYVIFFVFVSECHCVKLCYDVKRQLERNCMNYLNCFSSCYKAAVMNDIENTKRDYLILNLPTLHFPYICL